LKAEFRVICTFLLGAALAIPGFADAQEPDIPDEDAVIVADRRAALFLEDAPRQVRRRFQRALDEACDGARLDPPVDDAGHPIEFEYFCSGKPLRYLREVLANGERLEEGWICPRIEAEDDTKYFPADYTVFVGCVQVLWDYSERVPQVILEPLAAEPDQAASP
jgi:hypothetical protein